MSVDPHRAVTITRTSAGRYTAVNGRGGVLTFGTGDVNDFTPVDRLCTVSRTVELGTPVATRIES